MGDGKDRLHEINAVTIQTLVHRSYYQAYKFPILQYKHTYTSPDAPIYGFVKYFLEGRWHSIMLDVRPFSKVHCDAMAIWYR